jgi:hypothetical protein
MNLIQIQGYSATAAGAAILPFILLMSFLSRWSGGLVVRRGPRKPLILGPLVAGLGFILFVVPSAGADYWKTFFPALTILGLGMAITVAPLTTDVMNSVDQERVGTASGINNAVARVAGVLGIAVLGIVMVSAFRARLERTVDRLSLPVGSMQQIHEQGNRLGGMQPPGNLDRETKAVVTGFIRQSSIFGFRIRHDDVRGPVRGKCHDRMVHGSGYWSSVSSDAVRYFAFCSVLSELAGRKMNLDGSQRTGIPIWALCAMRLCLPVSPRRPGGRVGPKCGLPLCRYVADHEQELCVDRAPAVDRALHRLRRRGAKLGVVTGNLEQIGRLKLHRAGLLECFDFAAYSDDCNDRKEIVAQALRHARHLCGKSAAVCVVGDTPADIRAARANGLDVIAGATGIYSQEQLEMEEPDLSLTSFQQLFPESESAGRSSVPR